MATGANYNQQQYQSMADTAADAAGVPRNLFSALINQESGWNPYAFGNAGEIGLTQLMPSTASSLGIANAYDPKANLTGGASLLSTLYAKYKDWRKALATYNAGDPTSPVGLQYADAILGAAGPLAAAGPPADPTANMSWWEKILFQMGKDIGLATDSVAPGSNPQTVGEAGQILGSAAAADLPGALSGAAKYAILGVVVVAALGLGLYALTVEARRVAVPLARSAVS